MSAVAGELPETATLVSLMVGGRKIDKVSDGGLPVHYFLLDSSPWYVHTVDLNESKILYVKTPTGKIVAISGAKTFPNLLEKIQDREGISPDHQRII